MNSNSDSEIAFFSRRRRVPRCGTPTTRPGRLPGSRHCGPPAFSTGLCWLLLPLALACSGGASRDSAGDPDQPGVPGGGDPADPDPGPAPGPDADSDGDGAVARDDCDDRDPSAKPGNPEVDGNHKDDDCDGAADEQIVCGAAGAGQPPSLDAAVAAVPGSSALELCSGIYRVNLVVDKPLILLATPGAQVTLDGGGTNPVIQVVGAGEVTLDGLTIQNGNAEALPGEGPSQGLGGGVRCINSKLILTRSTIRHNRARNGAGVGFDNCAVEVTSNTFESNVASVSGGAMQLVNCSGTAAMNTVEGNQAEVSGAGVAQFAGTVAIQGNLIAQNVTPGVGAGIYHVSSAPLRGNLVTGNTANSGGGIYVVHNAPTVSENTVSNNLAHNDGGGIFLYESKATVAKNQVLQNEAKDDAGGIRGFGSQLLIADNTVRGNRAGDAGGGIKVSHWGSTIVQNLLEDNQSGAFGGGIELDDDYSTLLRNVIRGNRSDHGGGIHGAVILRSFRLEANIVAGNEAFTSGGGLYIENNPDGTVATMTFMTFAGNRSPNFGAFRFANARYRTTNSIFFANESPSMASDAAEWAWNNVFPAESFVDIGALTGASGNISADPLFTSAASHDYSLRPDSPARSAGDPSLSNASNGGRADMGAGGGPEGLR
jgi:parallel beta-helix repeat protein